MRLLNEPEKMKRNTRKISEQTKPAKLGAKKTHSFTVKQNTLRGSCAAHVNVQSFVMIQFITVSLFVRKSVK